MFRPRYTCSGGKSWVRDCLIAIPLRPDGDSRSYGNREELSTSAHVAASAFVGQCPDNRYLLLRQGCGIRVMVLNTPTCALEVPHAFLLTAM